MIRETEFIVQQYYKVTFDASPINNSNYSEPDADWAKEDRARNLRMFQAILADEKALQAVFEYIAIVDHAVELNSEEEFLTDHYGEEITFYQLLDRFAHIFTLEDKEYLQEMIKHEKDPKRDYDLSRDIEDCFKARPSGWNIQEHLCARKVQD